MGQSSSKKENPLPPAGPPAWQEPSNLFHPQTRNQMGGGDGMDDLAEDFRKDFGEPSLNNVPAKPSQE
eukprot:gene18757-6155_t